MKQSYLTFFLLLCLIGCQFFQEQPKKSFFDYQWNVDRLNGFRGARVDSTTIPYAVFWETTSATWGTSSKGRLSTLLPLFQARSAQPNITVNLHYQTENLSELYLTLVAFGAGERVLSVDTLHLPMSDEWTVANRSIQVENAMFLELFITAMPDIHRMERGDNSGVGIKELDVFVDRRRIDPNTTARTMPSLSRNDIIPFSSSDLSHLPFMDNKILSIGETLHGSETFNQIAADIIKERILHHNCRLVLLELPIEASLYINRYISGDPNFTRAYIVDYFDNMLFCSAIFVSLIDWIKEFNRYSEERVYFFGMDARYETMSRYLDLFDFFYALNSAENDEALKEMSRLALRSGLSIVDAISFFDANRGFENKLTRGESNLAKRALTLLYNSAHAPEFESRDRTMYENTQFFIENFLPTGSTVTIFSHFGHSNYRSLNTSMTYLDNYMPFGYYMRNRHQDNYVNIALLTYKGNSLLANSTHTGFQEVELHSSPIGSIEHLINRLNINAGYMSMATFTCDDALMIRKIGNAYLERQFRFIFPTTRMDGAIFVREVSAIQKNEEIMNRDVHPILRQFERSRQAALKVGFNASTEPFF